MRGIRALRASLGENVSAGGRPSKREEVLAYMLEHPEARKCDVIRKTGIGKTTVNKYYKEIQEQIKGGGNDADSKTVSG